MLWLVFMNNKINKQIFLDYLNFRSFCIIFFRRDIKKVSILEKIKPINRFFKFVLNFRGVKISEKSFFVGNLFTKDQKSIHLLAMEMGNKLSFKISNQIIKNNKKLNFLNNEYGNNTIRLYLAKQLKYDLIFCIKRGLVSIESSASPKTNIELLIKKPYSLDQINLNKIITGLTFKFYDSNINKLMIIKLLFSLKFKRLIKRYYLRLFSVGMKLPNQFTLGSVLSFQEDSIRNDQSLRNHFNWIDLATIDNSFNSFVVSIFNSVNQSLCNVEKLSKKQVYFLTENIFHFSMRRFKKHPLRKLIKKEIKSIFKAILKKNTSFSHAYLLLKCMNLFYQSESLASLCLFLNTKVFVTKDPQLLSSDAIQLVSKLINVKTICIQYSNVSRPDPMLMSTADEYLIFSNNYKKVLKTELISPKKFTEIGYCINGIQKKISERAFKIKNQIMINKVNFIIGYFDESISFDKWGLVSKEAYIKEIHLLAKYVIRDPTVCVIIKSQFIFNLLITKFSDDILVKKALLTNRFIEVYEGTHRNDVYPMQIGLIANICINHKFGATAGLETAIVGTRTILLDNYNYMTYHDTQYNKGKIIYSNLSQLLKDIDEFRSNNKNYSNLGDWSGIIDYFDKYRQNSVMKISNRIKSSLI